jgi:tetratricopeptide (TPR) repeat protein
LAIDREATLKNAEKLLRVGRLEAAITEYARVVDDYPRDWNTANALGDLYVRAGQPQRAVPLYGRVADHLSTEGFYSKAAALLRKILKIRPDDEAVQLRLAEISAQQGLMADARAYYSAVEKRRRQAGDAAGADEIVVRLGELDSDDLDARFAAARAAERRGRIQEAAEQYRQLYDEFLAERRESDAHGALRDSARCQADRLLANGDFIGAANVLQDCVARAPGHVPTLLKLVEVCVDGELNELVFEAQAMLADAYLATGDAADARVIAEDLVARDPGNPRHVERLRQALRALNVGDDGVDRAVGELASIRSGHATDPPLPEPARVTASQPTVDATLEAVREPPAVVAAAPKPPASSMEIDLTALLGELQGQVPLPEAPPRPPRELEQVFAEIRADAVAEEDASADNLDLARTYLEMGMLEEAAGSLQMAARSPRYRFAAASMLGEISRDQGDLRAAIEWFERAAEVPPPEPENGRALLYDLADLLETVGETARSLAVFLELAAEAPAYRDVAERIARLSRIETEG